SRGGRRRAGLHHGLVHVAHQIHRRRLVFAEADVRVVAHLRVLHVDPVRAAQHLRARAAADVPEAEAAAAELFELRVVARDGLVAQDDVIALGAADFVDRHEDSLGPRMCRRADHAPRDAKRRGTLPFGRHASQYGAWPLLRLRPQPTREVRTLHFDSETAKARWLTISVAAANVGSAIF